MSEVCDVICHMTLESDLSRLSGEVGLDRNNLQSLKIIHKKVCDSRHAAIHVRWERFGFRSLELVGLYLFASGLNRDPSV